MVPATRRARAGRHQAEKRFAARFMQPFQRAARLFHIGPPAGQIPAKLLGTDEILDGRHIFRGGVRH